MGEQTSSLPPVSQKRCRERAQDRETATPASLSLEGTPRLDVDRFATRAIGLDAAELVEWFVVRVAPFRRRISPRRNRYLTDNR
jgi:hypothetical protein